MRPPLTILAAIMALFVASCSSNIGIVKKSPAPGASFNKQVSVPKRDAGDAVSREGAFHIVGRNETLRHICGVYGLDLKKVAKINSLESPYLLKPGDTIFLPANALLEVREKPSSVASASKNKRQKRVSKRKRFIRNVAKAIRGKRHPLVPRLKFPVSGGELTSPFGYRWGVFHKGLDIAASVGTPVLACAGGRVIFTGKRKKFEKYGKIVLLDHGRGVYTQYAHLNRLFVRKGQRIRRGQKIASVGNTGRSTGPHLHLEVRVRNKMYNPLAYFSGPELRGMRVAKRFTNSPMGPVEARWRIPELLTAHR